MWRSQIKAPWSKKKIAEELKKQGWSFTESDTRMNYGFIGGIHHASTGASLISIFPQCFYVRSCHIPLNETTLELIRSIQIKYEHLNTGRDEDEEI